MASSNKRERILEEIDRWRSGDKASPGCSMMSERYALRMRLAIRDLEQELALVRDDKLAQTKDQSTRVVEMKSTPRNIRKILEAIRDGRSWRADNTTIAAMISAGFAVFVDWDLSVSTGLPLGWILTDAGKNALTKGGR